jgi:hypothetical protein
VPTIWVTNRIEQIDPAFRRRFAVPPGAEVAAARRARGAGAQDAGRRGRERGFVAKLAERKGLTPAQIRTAVRFALAGATGGRRGRPAVEALIERQLRNADRALGNTPHGAARAGGHHVRPGPCSTSSPLRGAAHRRGAARAATARCASTARRAPARRRWPSTSPGAAAPADDPQASDLMSKFVGETEQNMAAHVREATSRRRRAAARRGRQLPAGPPRRPAHLRGDRGQRDAAGHGALRRHLHLHHQPVGPTSTRRRCAASPSRSASAADGAQRERMFVAEALAGDATR